MAYRLTPEQYKDAAQRRISDQNTAENTNAAVSAYARAIRSMYKDAKQTAAEESQMQENSSHKSDNKFIRTLSTIASPLLKATEGTAKFVENSLVDFTAGLGATILEATGNEGTAKKWQNFAAKDYIGNVADADFVQSIYDSSYTNNWGKVGNLLDEGAYSVGYEAIPFALNFVPAVGPILSQVAHWQGGYGSGFESASQEGASVLGASLYGVVSGTVEWAIERYVGGAFSWGEDSLTVPLKKALKSGAARKYVGAITDAVGEGAEEVISGFIDNYIREMTYNADTESVKAYFENIKNADRATAAELWDQFLVGAFVGGVMGGVNTKVKNTSSTANSVELIQEINDLENKGYNLNQKGRDTSSVEYEISEKEGELVNEVNKKLERIEQGVARQDAAAISLMDFMKQNFNSGENGYFTTSKNNFVKNDNATYGMRESTLKNALTDGDVVNTVHEGAFEGKAAESKTNVQRAVANWNKRLGRNRLNVVFADMKDNQNYGYIKGNTVVINADKLGKTIDFTVTEDGVQTKYSADAGMSTLLHEVLHFTDDTKAGKTLKETLVKYATELDKDNKLMEELERSYPNASLGQLSSELSARQLENLLFNEKVINNLTADNSTLAKRILNRATRFLNALKGEKMSETKSLERLLDKTVKLYNKAIAQKGQGKTISAKSIDKNGETQYSKRATKYLSYNTVGRENVQYIRGKLTKLYDGISDGIADGIAIENGNTIYIVDSGKDNGEISFGVRKQIKISDSETRLEYLRRTNNDAVSKGHISDGLSSKLGNGHDNDWGRDLRRELGEKLSSDTRKSDNQQKGVSDEVRHSRRVKETSNERSDEFRRIQEESLAMPDGELQTYRSGRKGLDENLRGRLSRIYREEIHASRGGDSNDYGVLNYTGDFVVYKDVDADLFHDIFEINRNYLQNGELVDLHAVETTEDSIGYQDCVNYITEDGLSGFSITPDGDLISVFNLNKKRGFLRAISNEVKAKAKTLDCYNSIKQPLAGMYTECFGFQVASVMDYNMDYDHDNIAVNHRKPQVAFMVNTEKTVKEKHFTENQYDEAVAYQQSFVRQNEDGDIRYSRRARFSQEEISKAVDDTLQMLSIVSDIDEDVFDVSVQGKTKILSEFAAKINEQATNGTLSERSKDVKALVDVIIDNAVLSEHYSDDLSEQVMTLETLRPYLHSIDLSTASIKSDVQNTYGNRNNIFALWGKNGGTAWDTAVQEIVEIMPQLQGDSDIVTLFNIFDTYTKAVKDIKKAKSKLKVDINNIAAAKQLMAKQLVNSLSEQGTELVTKVDADKLQTVINAERDALQQTLRAVKAGDTDVSFDGQKVSQKVQAQLKSIVDLVAKERATVYANEKTESIIRREWKDVSDAELKAITKEDSYKRISEYIAERYADGEKVSVVRLSETQPALMQEFKRTISSVKRISVLSKNNANAARTLFGLDSKKLEKQLRELSSDDTYSNAFSGLKTAINGLFKQSTDGKNLLLSYDEMISTGALKNVVEAFDSYLVEGNPVLQDMVGSGLFTVAKEKVKVFKEYVASLQDSSYTEMDLTGKQTFNNAFTVLLSDIMQATKPETLITVKGEQVSAKKYRDKGLRSIDMMLQRDKNGEYKGEKRNTAVFFDNFFRNSVRPYEAIAEAENHSGVLETLFKEVRDGETKGELSRVILEDLIYDFAYDKANKVNGKKYANHLMNDEITIKHSDGEFVVTKGELIGLYLTLIQEDGFRHADASNPMSEGIYLDSKKSATVYRNKDALKFTNENVAYLESKLNKTDLRFIEVVRQFFESAGELKSEVDEQLYGVARLLGADYYPLQTDESARDSKVGDKVSFYDALDPSGHLSINQSRTSGLKALRVRNVVDLLTNYAKSVGLYYGVAVPIANMRLVYNTKGVDGDSIKDIIAKYSTKEFDKYLDKLLLDIQGAIKVNDTFMERRRQHYAAFAIAANIKSPVKALGGLFSLWGKLKTKSFLKGLTQSPFKLIKSGKADFSQMYEYCPAVRIRYRDKQATLSAMNVERGAMAKRKIVDKLAIGIELVDKYTVYVAWNAAKAEVGAVGADANNVELLKKAGQLLNETLDTIDRFEMSERNAYSRSADSFHRGLAMFTSSAQAQLTQFIYNVSSLSKLYHLKKQLPGLIKTAETARDRLETMRVKAEDKLKNAKIVGDKSLIRQAEHELRQTEERLKNERMRVNELIERQSTIDKDIKKFKLSTRKAIVSISMAIMVSALLSQLMSNLMGEKDEEEWGEDFAFGVLDEALSEMFGMLPYLGQIYNMIEFDIGDFEKRSYDMSFWVIDEWNMMGDAFNSFVALVDGTGNKTPARVARDFLYAIGQWFGIPTRNIYNVINTALKNFESVDYQWDNLFQKGNYGSDLKKAIDAGDTELADTILKLMMKDTFGGSETKVIQTVRSLYEQGYTNILPKTVSSSITINGETYNMTSKQQKEFKKIYSQADEKIERLIGKQSFVNLSPKVQADSIKWIYDYYYQQAKYNFVGLEDDSKKALFGSLIDVETLAVAYSYCNSIEADEDKKGNVVNGSKKRKVVKYINSLRISAAEKYMILGYLGYSPVNEKAGALITAHARKNGVDKEGINDILQECNIAA